MLCHSESRIDQLAWRDSISFFFIHMMFFFHQKQFGGEACVCGKHLPAVVLLLSVLYARGIEGDVSSPLCPASLFSLRSVPYSSISEPCTRAGSWRRQTGGRCRAKEGCWPLLVCKPGCDCAWHPSPQGLCPLLLGLKHSPSIWKTLWECAGQSIFQPWAPSQGPY